MKEDQELLETEASTMRRHQSMQRLSRGELVDSHMDEELVRNTKFIQGLTSTITRKHIKKNPYVFVFLNTLYMFDRLAITR